MKILRLLFFFLILSVSSGAQPGCTDPQASNYNPGATTNDGSCIYAPTSLSTTVLTTLDTIRLNEASGLISLNGNLWTQNDNTDSVIYRIDSISPAILDSVVINSANTDWEDLAYSNDYIYIGDFGNNYGSRTDLYILRFPRLSIDTSTATVVPDVINFSYADQQDFSAALNNTSYDCEALFFLNDSLHLFTKDWITKITKHYILPALPGNHSLMPVDSFDVNGLITSAAIQNDGTILLLGYDNTGFAPCFVWLLFDYNGSDFFSGNKRMFSLGSAAFLGQPEGIDFLNNNYGYISSERFQQLSFNVPPQLKSFDLSPYLITTDIGTEIKVNHLISVSPTLAENFISVEFNFTPDPTAAITITDMTGRVYYKVPAKGKLMKINTSMLSNGNYHITYTSHGFRTTSSMFFKK
jgi:hypothetical protein